MREPSYPTSFSRRRLLLSGLGALAATACSHTPALQSARTTIGLAIAEPKDYPRTRQQVDALPYAQLGFRVGNGDRAILVLESITGDQLRWVSSNRVSITTRLNRIVRTTGLAYNLNSTEIQTADLATLYEPDAGSLWGSRSTREMVLAPQNQRIVVESEFSLDADETVEILGERFQTRRIREASRCKGIRWRPQNTFWMSRLSNLAWRSVQHIHPDLPPIELEVLKRPVY